MGAVTMPLARRNRGWRPYHRQRIISILAIIYLGAGEYHVPSNFKFIDKLQRYGNIGKAYSEMRGQPTSKPGSANRKWRGEAPVN